MVISEYIQHTEYIPMTQRLFGKTLKPHKITDWYAESVYT